MPRWTTGKVAVELLVGLACAIEDCQSALGDDDTFEVVDDTVILNIVRTGQKFVISAIELTDPNTTTK